MTSMTLPAYLADEEARAGERESECTVCPPWVKMCAHFDGITLVLDELEEGDTHNQRRETYGVGQYVGRRGLCKCGKPHALPPGLTAFLATDDLAAAQDEFDRRAAALREGAGA